MSKPVAQAVRFAILGVALNDVQVHKSIYGGKYGAYQQYGYGYGSDYRADGQAT